MQLSARLRGQQTITRGFRYEQGEQSQSRISLLRRLSLNLRIQGLKESVGVSQLQSSVNLIEENE